MHTGATARQVPSAGLTLSVREYGVPASGDARERTHLVLVHGYPDQQEMWDPVVTELTSRSDLPGPHVVTYDVRGAGGSGTPPSRDGYRTELLVEDLVAVVQATVPDGERFHLVGHDWGSVQCWDAVGAASRDERLLGRVATYTSISGPSLDHVAALFRNAHGRRLRVLNQALHSWYVAAFHVPWLPDTLLARRNRNAANGLNLYRANIRRRMRDPGVTRTDVPVLLVVPTRDKFVTPTMLEDVGDHCSDLTRVEIDAGHWVTRSHPAEVAALVARHVREHL